MLFVPRKNGLDSLFKEVGVFKTSSLPRVASRQAGFAIPREMFLSVIFWP